MRSALGDAMLKYGRKYANMVVLTTDSSVKYVIDGWSDVYSEDRSFNLGLAEANAVSVAMGFAIRGRVPFVFGVAPFLTARAYEQIRDGICHSNLNVKLIGGYGDLSDSYDVAGRPVDDIALMRNLPNMKILCPADGYELSSMIEAMMTDFGPCYLRLPVTPGPLVYNEKYRFKFGEPSLVRRGRDVNVFTCGSLVSKTLAVAERLQDERGVSVNVVNLSSIVPLKKELLLNYVLKNKVNLVFEEHGKVGGLGALVSELLQGEHVVLKKFDLDTKDIYESILEGGMI